MNDLFGTPSPGEDAFAAADDAPLAARMRPRNLDEIVGQARALGPDTVLRRSIEAGELPSLILWGPPGCGKTTLAGCLAEAVGVRFLPYSAVRVGVKELKATMTEAARLRGHGHRAPMLFLDEIHRFNKAQQDALLPHVEGGDVILVGATTENPSFEVNAALLSRTRVVVLDALSEDDLRMILERALRDERGLERDELDAEPEALAILARRAGGDARFALGSLELAARATRRLGAKTIDAALAESVIAEAHLVYDKAGEEHFNVISALHKSLRNSDAQAGIYWLARMLEAGEDPMYVARRLVRFASEDVGLADPQALVQTVSASAAVQQIGMPEGALALAQACVYLAQAPKSNALYAGYQAARKAIAEGARDPVPKHLRNAPTRLMKDLDYGKDYRYAHDEPEGVAAMPCLPEALRDRVFYRPTESGFEAEAAARLRRAWKLAYRPSEASDDPEGNGEST
jgi:putative ATPase